MPWVCVILQEKEEPNVTGCRSRGHVRNRHRRNEFFSGEPLPTASRFSRQCYVFKVSRDANQVSTRQTFMPAAVNTAERRTAKAQKKLILCISVDFGIPCLFSKIHVAFLFPRPRFLAFSLLVPCHFNFTVPVRVEEQKYQIRV